jgi:hypothetical protein
VLDDTRAQPLLSIAHVSHGKQSPHAAKHQNHTKRSRGHETTIPTVELSPRLGTVTLLAYLCIFDGVKENLANTCR